jgi:hypothetical protein
MRKILLLCLLTIAFVIGGCSSSEPKSTLTLDSFIKAYTDAGVTVEPGKKQMFQIVGASDGVYFYMDTYQVKIYEYKTEKDMKEAIKKDEMLKDWPANGRFLLEANYDKAKEIFKNVK